MSNEPNETSHQRRTRLIAEIVRICGLETERVLRQQLESMSELAVDTTYRLITRSENGLTAYWRDRAERAERAMLGDSDDSDVPTATDKIN